MREPRREQILREARRILGEKGYQGFTVQELAQRCGVTNGALLYYFASKELLLLAVLQERDDLDRAFLQSDEMLGAQMQARCRIESALDVLRKIMIRDSLQPDLVRLEMMLRSEALGRDHPSFDHFRARQAGILAWIQALIAPHVVQPASVARQLLALADGLEQQWLREDQGFDLVEEWDRAVANYLTPSAL